MSSRYLITTLGQINQTNYVPATINRISWQSFSNHIVYNTICTIAVSFSGKDRDYRQHWRQRYLQHIREIALCHCAHFGRAFTWQHSSIDVCWVSNQVFYRYSLRMYIFLTILMLIATVLLLVIIFDLFSPAWLGFTPWVMNRDTQLVLIKKL